MIARVTLTMRIHRAKTSPREECRSGEPEERNRAPRQARRPVIQRGSAENPAHASRRQGRACRSLDPLATGMLPICLGEATKIAGDILSGRKLYRFTVALGSRTATGDTEGAVVETAAVPQFDDSRLAEVLKQFQGPQTQIPPMYSALKRDGQPLYKLARAGIEVERAARDIEIFTLTALASSASDLELQVLCSKGTYVRTLAEDIAKALGTCGHVRSLRRVYVEPFGAAPMETLESIARALEAETLPVILQLMRRYNTWPPWSSMRAVPT